MTVLGERYPRSIDFLHFHCPCKHIQVSSSSFTLWILQFNCLFQCLSFPSSIISFRKRCKKVFSSSSFLGLYMCMANVYLQAVQQQMTVLFHRLHQKFPIPIRPSWKKKGKIAYNFKVVCTLNFAPTRSLKKRSWFFDDCFISKLYFNKWSEMYTACATLKKLFTNPVSLTAFRNLPNAIWSSLPHDFPLFVNKLALSFLRHAHKYS